MPRDLSQNDKLVLSRVLDAHSTGSLLNSLVDPELPMLPQSVLSGTVLADLQSQENSAIAPLNTSSPTPELLQQAVDKLTDLIISYPTYPSAYNNRAQVLRLLHGDDLYNAIVSQSTLWDDLCKAIELVSPERRNVRISDFQGRILKAAYAQRGYLTWKAAKKEIDPAIDGNNLPDDLQDLAKEEMEEKARADLEMAGKYGDVEAMKMAVSANPYARLCGNIVQEAMRAEMEKMRGTVHFNLE